MVVNIEISLASSFFLAFNCCVLALALFFYLQTQRQSLQIRDLQISKKAQQEEQPSLSSITPLSKGKEEGLSTRSGTSTSTAFCQASASQPPSTPPQTPPPAARKQLKISAAANALLNNEAHGSSESFDSEGSGLPSYNDPPSTGGLGSVLFCADAVTDASPFEAAMAKWPKRELLVENGAAWDLKSPQSQPLERKSTLSSNGSDGSEEGAQSETGLKQIRTLPDLLRARSMQAELGGLELGPLLGKGSFGKVYKARWRSCGVCAVKVINHDHCQASKLEALKESAVSSCLQHPNVLITYKVLSQPSRALSLPSQPSTLDSAKGHLGHRPSWHKYVDGDASSQLPPRFPTAGSEGHQLQPRTYEDRCKSLEQCQETWMLMEYCDRGNLDKAIQAGRFRLRENPHVQDLGAIYRTLIDIACGMDFLHSLGVLHGDLKSCNVLLKSTSQYDDPRGFVAKLADFGLSQILEPEATHVSTNNFGTVAYMPAELLTEGKMQPGTDVWSFGCIMWEMWVRERMYQDVGIQQVFCRVLTGRRSAIPQDMPEGYRELLDACWDVDPLKRPPFCTITRWLRTLHNSLGNGQGEQCSSMDLWK